MILRKLFFFAVLVQCTATIAWAQETHFRVLGIQGQVLMEQRSELSPGSVGAITHAILVRSLAQGYVQQYQGSDSGVLSINGLGSALEVLSDTQMNAYGWCYRIDGKLPGIYANQYQLTGEETQIEWFYGYAHLEEKDWTSMCVPADHKPVQE